MPEGDTVAGHARLLRPVLVGERVESVYGTAPSLRAGADRVRGERLESIRTLGKNLMIDFSSGYSLRIHLGMSGRWRLLPAHGSVPGEARVGLSTQSHHAVCLGAPTVELDRTGAIDRALEHLGPDLLAEGFDEGEALRRMRARDGEPVGEVLLDQRVVAGIGNVYKSEVLHIEKVHPKTLVEALSDESLRSITRRARRLLRANVGPKARSTTGERSSGRLAFVYGRKGRPCRRCRTAIRMERLGE